MIKAGDCISRITLILVFLFGFLAHVAGQGKDDVISRLILIGDAGEQDSAQVQIIRTAANQVLKGKTTVLFLGDNIYPNGMALSGTADQEHTQQILRSQFVPLRAAGAVVLFIPGNHDWDRSGPQGLEKVKAEWKYISDQRDSGLRMLPANGCPEPQEIHLTADLTLVLFDSEWWLFPYNKENKAGCSCSTIGDVVEAFAGIRRRNAGKIVLLASHHPFMSYGNHGGHYSLTQHLFPLRDLNKSLYVPLPILGSLFQLTRTVFAMREDLKHPVYKTMISQVDGVFAGFENLTHIAGHEHGLQFIERDGKSQIISGSGAKLSHVVHGKYARYADASPGYVIVDQISDKSLRFSYYKLTDTGIIESFYFIKPYIRGRLVQHHAEHSGKPGETR